MKKILLIHNVYWAHYKAAVFSSLWNLAPAEHLDVRVVHIARSEGIRKGMEGNVDSLHRYPHEVLFDARLEEVSTWDRVAGLIKAIHRYPPDVVVIPGYYDLAYWFLLPYLLAKRFRVIVAVDSTIYDKPRFAGLELMKSIFLHFADCIFGYGTRSREYCIKLRVPEDKIVIRCQATSNDAVRDGFLKVRDKLDRTEPRSTVGFVYVGRLSSEKNIDALLWAFRSVRERSIGQRVRPRLRIVGSGPDEVRLRAEVADIPEDVQFIGGVGWQEIPGLLARDDVLVLPSKSEPWGLVVNEAMLCEMPVIVSQRCGCAPDLVSEGVNGYTFDPDSVEELAGHMMHFVETPGDIATMGKRGLEIVGAFTPEQAARQMIEGFHKVLGPRVY